MTQVYLSVANGTGSGWKTAGTNVSVTATVPPHYHFVYWEWISGTISMGSIYSASNTVVPSTNASIKANSSINIYTVTFDANSGGSLTGDTNQTLSYNEVSTGVTAVPDEGYHFTGWNIIGNNPLYVIAYSNMHIIAYFEPYFLPPDQYALTVTSGTGDGNYYGGTVVNIVADAPAPAHHFTYWSGDTTGIANVNASTTTITTQSSAATIVANYAPDAGEQWTLTYSAGNGGTIVGTAIQTVANAGNGTEVTGTPITGYYFVNWSDAVTTAARIDTNVTGNITVTANFSVISSGYVIFV